MSAKIHGLYSVRVAVAIALGTVAMAVATPQVRAADADTSVNKPAAEDVTQVEEVTVTGSRIRRKDLTSTSPLVTVDSEQIEQRSGLNLESYLNLLPNYNPAQTPTTVAGDVQPSAVNTVGVSTISLRGFGPNRSLVLIDGHRTTPVNALMVTDLNGIPSAMIDKIEIITGGASAVYGADAIGGVTNFLLKKSFEGVQFDVQDGISQAGDGNELRVSTIMGSKIAEGRGNIIMGLEYYNRDVSYQKNHSFFSNAWSDPLQSSTNSLFAQEGTTGIAINSAVPTNNAINVVFGRAQGNTISPFTATGTTGRNATYYFNPGGSIYTLNAPYTTDNRTGPTSGLGIGLYNTYDPAVLNSSANPNGAPPVVQNVKMNDSDNELSAPQTRYSVFANGTYDLTDKVQFYTNARFAETQTQTRLSAPPTLTAGWNQTVPYNPTTDSPINPALISPTSTYAQLQTIYTAFLANPTSNAFVNPNFKGDGVAGAQHPVPWQLALLLNTRTNATNGGGALGGGIATGGPSTCNNSLNPNLCSLAPSSWSLAWIPYKALPARTTTDITESFQIEMGLKFPLMVSDWTGELYYSRGQSLNYEDGYGNESLQRMDALISSPDYGRGQSLQGNYNNSTTNFGTSVPSTCTSGFYGSIFGGDVSPSADCLNAVGSTLQTYTAMQQDIVEANFNGTVFKLPAGDVSAALGYQYRRDAGQFTPDNLQATNSFLDQTVGLYPLGTLQSQEISAKDGYAELFIPIVKNLPLLKQLNLDIGGRYSSYDKTPNATTFKVSIDDQLTNSLKLRGGFNRATRAPNLGELYLGVQEYFIVGGNQYGDPCSLRSLAPFGAATAAPDTSQGSGARPQPTIAGGQTAAGALSTYLICQAQMGGLNSVAGQTFYGVSAQSVGGSAFNWLNEQGNPALKSETADTWTGGLVFAQLSDNPWLAGLNGSIDWWQVHITNAIEISNSDVSNYNCYGTTIVTNAAQAAAQAATPACINVGRNLGTGAASTTLLTYTNAANIGTAGVDLQLNWIAQLADLGFKSLPGAIAFSSQDTFMDYYRTKNSPASFDLTTDWKGSLGPNLAGTNPGAYSYRLNASIGYVLPSITFNLHWTFLPSVNTAAKATENAVIAHNAEQPLVGNTCPTCLSYTPGTTIAAAAWNSFDLSFNWTINKTFSLRGGINNLMDKSPSITGATAGYPGGTNLSAVCSAAAIIRKCTNPTTYSLPNDGAGLTNVGFYDVYGRRFFLGAKAQF